MDRISTQISRKELYEQVWSVPMWTLARKYGLSDVGLAKICKKNDIPRPPRGYWAKKQSGRKLQTPPLPKSDINRVIEIHGHIGPPSGSPPKRISLKKIYPKEILKNDIFVPDDLKNPHPLVARAMEFLEGAGVDRNGLVQPPNKQCLDILVSPESLPRALRIWDSLIKALNEYGFEVSLAKGVTEVSVNGVAVGLAMSEQLVRKWREPRDHDLDGHYYQFGYNQYADHSQPSGNLCLSIQDLEGSGWRKNWRDVGTRRLENILRLVILSILRTAAKVNLDHERKGMGGNEKL